MRRLLAIALLLAFGSPLVLPLFASVSNPVNSLPACCRLHGKHHCAMRMEPTGDNSPAFQGPACPLYPSSFLLPQISIGALNDRGTFSAELLRERAADVPSYEAVRGIELKTTPNRGPPRSLD